MSRDQRPPRGHLPHRLPQAFLCAHCGTTVPGEAQGTRQRNHCPRCLRSLHVDVTVGDRRSLCRGVMDPISVWVRHGAEMALLHRCRRCGVIRSNRVAGDDDPEPLRDLVRLIGAADGAAPPRFPPTGVTVPDGGCQDP